MSYEVFNDFKLHSKVSQELIEKYRDKLPPELIEIWQEYGFGTFLNGYLKTINPDDYVEILDESYFASDVSVPIFATALGDLITWQKKRYVYVIKYRKGTTTGLSANFDGFINSLHTEYEFYAKKLDNRQYEKALKKYGLLEYDECFGYVPLLALGGSEKVENLQKVKIREHIILITQVAGRIE